VFSPDVLKTNVTNMLKYYILDDHADGDSNNDTNSYNITE